MEGVKIAMLLTRGIVNYIFLTQDDDP